jgi:hypothetical protein
MHLMNSVRKSIASGREQAGFFPLCTFGVLLLPAASQKDAG